MADPEGLEASQLPGHVEEEVLSEGAARGHLPAAHGRHWDTEALPVPLGGVSETCPPCHLALAQFLAGDQRPVATHPHRMEGDCLEEGAVQGAKSPAGALAK